MSACDSSRKLFPQVSDDICQCSHTPLCRYHHATKQTPGWRLTQSRPGIMIWTTPGGRSYATYPTGYLG